MSFFHRVMHSILALRLNEPRVQVRRVFLKSLDHRRNRFAERCVIPRDYRAPQILCNLLQREHSTPLMRIKLTRKMAFWKVTAAFEKVGDQCCGLPGYSYRSIERSCRCFSSHFLRILRGCYDRIHQQ